MNPIIKARVAISSFTSLSVFLFIAYMRNVVVKMTGNSNYITPIPPLADVTTALDDLETKAVKAQTGTTEDTAIRNVAWDTTADTARTLGSYTQLTAKFDIEKLLSSGFEAQRGRGPVQPVNMPLNLRVAQGNTGELDLRWVRDGRNSLMFEVQHATAPDGPYTNHPSVTTNKTTIGTLTPGTMIWQRVRANGAGGSSDWTAPVCKMVT
jgi:hypothetical protein